jgi:hypothetical protein
MKRALVERNIAVILFILVLIVFSFAERDSKKLAQLYKTGRPELAKKINLSTSVISLDATRSDSRP